MRASDRNENLRDDSFAQLGSYNDYLKNDYKDEASLNVSQYDSFQTCEDDSIYYETFEDFENPQIPTLRQGNQNRELLENPEPIVTTDTERYTSDTDCVTSDSERYTSATDTGYSTSNA